MAEPDSSEALQGEIDAAMAADDLGLADSLYQRQIGSTDLARSREPGEPAPEVEDKAKPEGNGEDPGPSPSDIEDQGGSRLADYKPYGELSEDEQGQEFDRVFSLADPDTSRGILQAEWPGADFDQNVAFGEAVLAAVPGSLDVLRVLEVVGLADHPDLIRWVASVGRSLAGKSGDPTSIPSTLGKGKQMSNSKAVEAQIAALEDEMDKAEAVNDSIKLQELYEKQQGLYRLLPGGADPAVGSSGGPTI